MAFNYEKHRYECDRCGRPIPKTKVVQLCRKCELSLRVYKTNENINDTNLFPPLTKEEYEKCQEVMNKYRPKDKEK